MKTQKLQRIGLLASSIVLAMIFLGLSSSATAAPISNPLPGIDLNLTTDHSAQGSADSLKIVLILTVLSLAPSILVLMTSFTRIVIILSFTRTALGTNQMPPNQVMVGLALFLSFFIMAPTFSTLNETALQPYLADQISQTEALDRASSTMKSFMVKSTREKDLKLFLDYLRIEKPKTVADVPLTAMVPAYVISELKTAFQMGFLIFIPFLVVDMIVSAILMAMGMMMLPPAMISLPFKILLFVLADGWYLVVRSILISFGK